MNFQSNFPLVKLVDVAPITTERVLQFDGLKPYVATADVQDSQIVASVDVDYKNKPSRANISVKANDVTFARMQSTNKVLLIGNTEEKYIFSTGFAVCRPTQKILPKYLKYWLVSDIFNEQKDSYCTGATQKAIPNSGIEKIFIPLPPLPEQERIVRLLDEAESLRAARARANARMEEFVPALLQEMFGDVETNDKKWKAKSLNELLSKIESGWSPVCLDRPVEQDEWGMLKLGALTSCEYDDTQNKAFPKELEPHPELEVKARDVLFSRKNTHDLVAACVFVFETRPKLMLSDLTFRLCIRDENELLPEYLWQVMIQPNKRKKIQTLATGSAAQMPNISKTRLLTIEIPIPPLALQREFAVQVGGARGVQSAQGKSAGRVEALYQSMLSRAFAGEL